MRSSFRNQGIDKIWKRDFAKKIYNQIQSIAYQKLVILARSTDLDDLKIPQESGFEKHRMLTILKSLFITWR
ncbi:MAG: hypothetical protein O9264_06645 [Leptospira sp.]|nr:hypothetical protein [Leptospira sp.]